MEASAEYEANCSVIQPNVYIDGLDILARLLRLEAVVALENDSEWAETEKAVELLNSALTLCTRIVGLPPQVTLLCEFTRAVALKRGFLRKLADF